MKTSSPALNTNTFAQFRENLDVQSKEEQQQMTVQGAVNRTGFLLLVCFATATWSWSIFFSDPNGEAAFSAVAPYLFGGMIGGLILAIATIFKKTWAPYTAPLYAACEGLFLGGISSVIEMSYPGIAMQAVTGTVGVLFAMLFLYSTRIVKVNDKFVMIVAAATMGVMLIYLANWILSMFGLPMSFIHSSGWMGIGFSLVVVVIASLNLFLDFRLIEDGANAKAPKFMEWYSAFALMVTLVWLYIEILNLLSKLRDR
jgi:uncharacterized YccA/Bax inhibitor family protein